MNKDFNKPHNYVEDNQWQVKNLMINQETLQRKALLDHKKQNLANHDFSCMQKKD